MEFLNKLFCENIYDFVSERINEVKDDYNKLGFKNSDDLLNQIKTDIKIAVWALTELLWWGLKENYTKKTFTVSEFDLDTDTPTVYVMPNQDRKIFFSIGEDNNGDISIIEMEPITVTSIKWVKKAN